MRIVLLPGLDGTGRLFKRFLAAAPPGLMLTAVSLPENASTYDELAGSVARNNPVAAWNAISPFLKSLTAV